MSELRGQSTFLLGRLRRELWQSQQTSWLRVVVKSAYKTCFAEKCTLTPLIEKYSDPATPE